MALNIAVENERSGPAALQAGAGLATAEDEAMNQADPQAMMKSMMDQFCGGMSADATKEMCASMMAMMSGGGVDGFGKMQDMMSKMYAGGPQPQMPEMMLTMMMPQCIGMMLPAIPAGRRGAVAAKVLSALVEKGTAGMTADERQAFMRSLDQVLHPSA